MQALTRFLLALPAGLVESPFETLVAFSLAVAGVVDFLIPQLRPTSLDHVLPLALVWVWGGFMAAGGLASMASTLARGYFGVRGLPRVLGSIGSWLLGTSVLSYTIIVGAVSVASTPNKAGSLVAVGILGGTAISFIIKALVLSPGVYERLLARQLQREVRRISKGP